MAFLGETAGKKLFCT